MLRGLGVAEKHTAGYEIEAGVDVNLFVPLSDKITIAVYTPDGLPDSSGIAYCANVDSIKLIPALMINQVALNGGSVGFAYPYFSKASHEEQQALIAACATELSKYVTSRKERHYQAVQAAFGVSCKEG
jgi:hypothetical protein